MDTKKKNLTKVLGIITILSAIGIIVLNYFTKEDFLDSLIIPCLLIWLGTIFITRKQKGAEEIKLSDKNKKILLSGSLIALIAGIATFFLTVL